MPATGEDRNCLTGRPRSDVEKRYYLNLTSLRSMVDKGLMGGEEGRQLLAGLRNDGVAVSTFEAKRAAFAQATGFDLVREMRIFMNTTGTCCLPPCHSINEAGTAIYQSNEGQLDTTSIGILERFGNISKHWHHAVTLFAEGHETSRDIKEFINQCLRSDMFNSAIVFGKIVCWPNSHTIVEHKDRYVTIGPSGAKERLPGQPDSGFYTKSEAESIALPPGFSFGKLKDYYLVVCPDGNPYNPIGPSLIVEGGKEYWQNEWSDNPWVVLTEAMTSKLKEDVTRIEAKSHSWGCETIKAPDAERFTSDLLLSDEAINAMLISGVKIQSTNRFLKSCGYDMIFPDKQSERFARNKGRHIRSSKWDSCAPPFNPALMHPQYIESSDFPGTFIKCGTPPLSAQRRDVVKIVIAELNDSPSLNDLSGKGVLIAAASDALRKALNREADELLCAVVDHWGVIKNCASSIMLVDDVADFLECEHVFAAGNKRKAKAPKEGIDIKIHRVDGKVYRDPHEGPAVEALSPAFRDRERFSVVTETGVREYLTREQWETKRLMDNKPPQSRPPRT